jgi:hypothetical protein
MKEMKQTNHPTKSTFRYDRVEIDLPSLEEIETALKYLNNNKAADADSNAPDLLKISGPQLVDALQEVI